MSLFTEHYKIIIEDYTEGIASIENYALGGRIRNLANPMMKWFNGSTYALAYKANTFNNQVWITKQTGLNTESYTVGVGTTSPEPLNHPVPIIMIDDAGYIYVAQSEFHVAPFRLWRSDTPENISSFTQIGTFDTDGSYLAVVKQDNTNVTILTRSGDNSVAVKGYDYSCLEVDLTDSSYTDTLIVEMNFGVNQVRAYLGGTTFYGVSDYRACGLNSRKESTSIYYKYSILITEDFNTFSNIGLGFSKDVVSTSAVTYAELDVNFAFIGSDSAQSTDISACEMIQINDSIFVSYRTGVGTYGIKTANIITGVESSIELGLSLFNDTGGNNSVYMYYNGSNIVVTTKMTDESVNLYTLETDLTNLTFVRVLGNMVDGNYVGFPANLNEVDDLYLIIGRSSSTSEVPYIITSNKWFS